MNLFPPKRLMFRFAITILICATIATANPHWIWLSDKGFEIGSAEEAIAIEKAENSLTERSIARRIKARGADKIVDYRDIPPSKFYIDQIQQAGAEIRTASRTLNAVSVNAAPDALEKIAQLSFVVKITPVAKRPYIPEPRGFASVAFDIDYGNSFSQNNLVNTPYAHRLGLHGDSVLISITDTGFKLDHEAMAGSDLIASYDFVDDDSIVTIEPGDPSATETHGTKVWSIIAGDSGGNLVGIAREASILLARTENYDDEYPGEEDHWIASAEWADSIGADIITLSLGYYEWYTSDSMTGDIAPISVAADRMAENGIVVTAAAGNNGAGITTISAPGDADSIITVGAVNPDGNVSGFSSRGPTADGRIKPEICTMGSGVWTATSSSTTSYGYSYGTSAATPIAAGLSAILLQARPYLLPMDVREALMMTANNRSTPDNNIGWGIPDVRAALSYPIAGRSELPVYCGWNLMSIPVEDALPADSAFPGRVGEVWSWNSDSADYVAASLIEGGEAYFVLYDRDTIISIGGEPLTEISKAVSPGWHTLGGIRPRTFLPSFASLSTAELDIILYHFDPIEQKYIQSKTLSPGQGAFILVLNSGDINLTE